MKVHAPDELWFRRNHNQDTTIFKSCSILVNKTDPIPKVCDNNKKRHRHNKDHNQQQHSQLQSSLQTPPPPPQLQPKQRKTQTQQQLRCTGNRQSSSTWRLQPNLSFAATTTSSSSSLLSVPYLLIVTFITVSLIISDCSGNTLTEETVTKYHTSTSKNDNDNVVKSTAAVAATAVVTEQQEENAANSNDDDDDDDAGKEVLENVHQQQPHYLQEDNNRSQHRRRQYQGRNYYRNRHHLQQHDSSSGGSKTSGGGGSSGSGIREYESLSFPTYYAAYITNAVESGVREANNLYESVEPDLYKKDLVIKGDHPAFYLAAINRQSPKAKELAKYAYATLKATTVLKEQLAQLRDERDHPISEISLSGTPFQGLQRSMCPTKRQIEESCPPWTLRYRKVDGMCNNLHHIHMGSSFQPFGRYLPPEYDDGVSKIRKSVSGKELPSARKISTTIHRDVSNPSSTFTLMVMQWGQFIDHDLTSTSQTRAFNHSIPRCCNVPERHPDCMIIEIPDDDPHFNGTHNCMEFIRSSPAPRTDCTLGPREQLNQLTSWMDGSVVYGSTDSDLQALRMFTKGHLRYSHMSGRKSLLPRLVHPPEDDCVVSSPRLFCFAAGDGRVNEQPGLTVLHTVWMRQHNFVADKLAEINPHWEEERLFQETRKIIIAQLQFITYREFLPLILGPDVIKVFGLRLLKTGYYHGYNDTVDATIPSVFAAAAFRFGHSLVQPNINRCDESHREMPYKVDLSQEMMSPMNIHNFGEVDRISMGLVTQKSQRRDEFITSQLTNHLFKTRFHPGLDLAAINIQRGRDHGLPPYLRWREACGLNNKVLPNNRTTIVDWEDFSIATEIPPEKVQLFSKVYMDPWDVDLFPGAMIEYPVKGGLLGPTFSCIIAQTFRNLRRGDRFWFENPGMFSESQLKALRNITLSRVMCDTSDAIKTIQPIAFLAPQGQKNALENCTDAINIPLISYAAWKEEPFSEAALQILREGGILPNQPYEEPMYYTPIEATESSSSPASPSNSPMHEMSTDYFANLPPYLQKKFQTLFS